MNTRTLWNKHLIIEGCDRTWKSSLIQHIQSSAIKWYDNPYQVIHSQNFKTFKPGSGETVENHSMIYYSQQMNLWKTDPENCKFIFDRAHLGETVYSPLYRKYSGQYVWALERLNKRFSDNVVLILMTDNAENLIEREDGESLAGSDLIRKQTELNAFDKAFNDSSLKYKIRIDISKYKNVEEVFVKIMQEFSMSSNFK